MHRFCFILLLAFAGVSAFRCSNSSSPQVTLKVVHWGGYMEKEWRSQIIEPFEREHPNIKIDLSIVPYNIYTQRLLAAAASGAPIGDVLMVDDWFAVELMHRNFAIDLTKYIRESGMDTNAFFPDVLREWRRYGNGTLCGLPYSAGVTMLFYNNNLFDAAHLAYPDTTWTYDDVLRDAKLLVRRDAAGVTTQWGMLIDNGGYTGFDTFVKSNGGVLMRSPGEAGLDDPATVQAVARWVGIVRTDSAAPQPSGAMEQFNAMFSANKAAMMLVGDHAAKHFAGDSLRWDMTMPPSGAAGRFSERFSDGFIIPKDCTHPAEAWELLKWIVTYPPQTDVAKIMEKGVPCYMPLAASLAWKASVGEPRANLLSETLDKYSFSYISPGWYEWRDNILTPALDQAFLGAQTPAQAMSDAEKKVNEVLARVGK